ncbi:MAG: hypothetical protein ACOCV7_01420 [Desulfonatronovibrionaceae bacterium]
MLVQNFFQITAKNPEDIKSEIAPRTKTLRIDPDTGKNESETGQQDLSSRKKKDDEKIFPPSDKVDTNSGKTAAYHVYNRDGKVVHLKISG